MQILIAGRLGRYAERILALRDFGHSLVYLNMPAPSQKPLPDNIGDQSIPQYLAAPGDAGRMAAEIVRRHDVDVIYSIKNVWDGSLELLDELLDAELGVPIVRHYKEHFQQPSEMERRSLLETDAQIYLNEESLQYFVRTYGVRRKTAHILETDFLPASYVSQEMQTPLFERDGVPHVLYAGGLANNEGRSDVREIARRLAERGIAVHLYGRKFIGRNDEGVVHAGHLESQKEYELLEREGIVTLFDHVEPKNFVQAWSGYDVGLMHSARPDTDAFAYFNYPNRVSPYLCCGLPLAQAGQEHVALRRLIQERNIGLLFDGPDDFADALHDRPRIDALRRSVLDQRHTYTFEFNTPALESILAAVT